MRPSRPEGAHLKLSNWSISARHANFEEHGRAVIYDIAGPPRVKGGIVLTFPKKSSLGLKREDGLSNRLGKGGRAQPPLRLRRGIALRRLPRRSL
jgi:hypothetical protein